MQQGLTINKKLLLNGITLESASDTTQAASARVIMDTSNCETLNLMCNYTVGASETTNTATIVVWGYGGTKGIDEEIVADTANWFQQSVTTVSAGAGTTAVSVYNIAGASAATYSAHFIIPICWSKIRISAYEAGVATNKGTLTVVASAL